MKKILQVILKYVIYFIIGFALFFIFFRKDGILNVLGYVLAMTLAIAICDLISSSKKNKKSKGE